MKLPKKKSNTEYNHGWDSVIEDAKYLCKNYDEDFTKRDLLRSKEYALKRKEDPFFKGVYDCVVEIEKLNEMTEGE